MFTLEYKHGYKRLFNTLSGVSMSTAVPSIMSTVLEGATKYIIVHRMKKYDSKYL